MLFKTLNKTYSQYFFLLIVKQGPQGPQKLSSLKSLPPPPPPKNTVMSQETIRKYFLLKF